MYSYTMQLVLQSISTYEELVLLLCYGCLTFANCYACLGDLQNTEINQPQKTKTKTETEKREKT